MAQVSLPYTLTAGQPENVNQLVANLDALVAGVNTVNTAQIADANVTTAKIADAAVTADKLGSTLAGQLGVSQTGTSRSVTITQTAETTTTNTSGSPATLATSSELTTAANGFLRIALWGEAKSNNASGQCLVVPQLSDAGTYRTINSGGGRIGYNANYLVEDLAYGSVLGTAYKAIAFHTIIPFASGGVESSSGKSQFRLVFYSSNASYTAYVKNLTATMTYIAV